MTPHRPRLRRLAFALALVSVAPLAAASPSTDDGYRTYRCVMLDDRTACPAEAPEPAVRIEERLQLGPLAAYQRHLGASTEDAIAAAREYGEHPVRRIVRITRKPLDAKALHDHVVSGRSRVREETLARWIDDGQTPAPAERQLVTGPVPLSEQN